MHIKTYKIKQPPQLPVHFFWDFDINEVDWEKSYRTIIERVLERGKPEHWKLLVNYYGQKKVKHTVTHELGYLTDPTIERACEYFNLKKENLRCYIRKQSLPKLWY